MNSNSWHLSCLANAVRSRLDMKTYRTWDILLRTKIIHNVTSVHIDRCIVCVCKIRAVKEFPTPTSDQQLRQFLGLASYLRRFVKGFASIAGPLHAILGGTGRKGRKRSKPKDDRKFSEKWNIQGEQAFINMKESLSSPQILAYPDYKLPFILEVDA